MRKMLLLAVFLLAACSSAPPASPSVAPTAVPPTDPPGASPSSPGPTTSPVPPTPSPAASTDPAAAEWRVLAEGLSLPEAPFAVRAALAQDAFAGLWSDQLSQDDPVPTVDFERAVVLYMGMSGSSSCPEALEGIVVDHQNAHVYGQWRTQQLRACTDDLAPQGVLLAVRRDVLPEQTFLLSLRPTPICADCADHPDQLFVDPSATSSR